MRWKYAYRPLRKGSYETIVGALPKRAITGLCIVIMRRVATNLEFMGQQWCRIYFDSIFRENKSGTFSGTRREK